jgi:CRISPR/Cas system CSM-associated protein Csm3 (group 7 of RAMP superfamily)
VATRTDSIAIDYTLTFETPFHFGTGLSAGLIDRTIVRDHDGFLYVPGSTFKGVLREQCEILERLYEAFDPDMLALIDSPHNDRIALSGLGRSVTMITRIFGSHHHPGHLFFDDAYLTDDEKEQFTDPQPDRAKEKSDGYRQLQVDLYTQVRLDRPTRTAVPGALYTSEFGVRSMVFEGKISGWLECTPIEENQDGPTYSLLLLLAGLHMIERMGGNKSTGKGKCTCEIKKLRINGRDYLEKQWQPWLDSLSVLSFYSEYGGKQEEEV